MASTGNYSNHAWKKKGMLRTGFGICKEEGLPRLWQGISPSLTRHVIYSGIRLTVYEKLREIVTQNLSNGRSIKDKNSSRTNMTIHHRIICGMLSGAIGQFIASPADLVKVKMQMQGREQLMSLVTKNGNAVKGSNNMVQVFLDVLKTGGIGSLWKGIHCSFVLLNVNHVPYS